MKLFPSLSLPQRLVICIFNPIIVFIFASLLLTIWSDYVMIDLTVTKIEGGGVDSVSASSTALVTTTATVTTTTTTTAVSTASQSSFATYYFDRDALEHVAQEYIEMRIKWVNATLSASYSSQLSQWQHSLDMWNVSLIKAINDKREIYQNLLAYNQSIFNALYEKSKQINETWSLFSQTALSLEDTQQVFNNLSVNYWFATSIFSNVSQQLQVLNSFDCNSKIPVIGFMPIDLNFDKSKQLDTSVTSFTNTLVNSLRENKYEAPRKRGNNLEASNTSLKKRSRYFSIICLIMYFVSIGTLCIYEWLIFRIENSLFNSHMMEILDTITAEETRGITLQQWVRKQTNKLCYTLTNPLLYRVANSIGSGLNESDSRWKYLSYYILWTLSNGKYLWILLFYTINHWQITSSLVSHQVSSAQGNFRREVTSPLTDSRLSLMKSTLEICSDFTFDVDKTIDDTLKVHFIASLDQQVDVINSQMTELSHNPTIAALSQWQNLSYSSPHDFEVNGNEFSYSVMTQALNSDSSKFVATHLSKRNTSNFNSSISETAWNKVYKWAVLLLIILLVLHFIIGLVFSVTI